MASAPPIPTRERRGSLSEGNNTTPNIQDLQISEHSDNAVSEEHIAEDLTATEVQNGEPLIDQQVAPERYLWYSAHIDGSVEDLIQFEVSRTLHGGATNIYVNVPATPGDTTTAFPTRDNHAWNPKKGPLYGPPGTYLVGVEGVPSFIEKDDKWLVDPNSNWATFDLYVSWTVLDPETRSTIKKMKDQYTKEKASNVWSNNYNAEVSGKYQQQQEEYANELLERQRQEEAANAIATVFNVEGSKVSEDYTFEGNELIYQSDFCIVRPGKAKANNSKVAIKIINKDKALLTGLDHSMLQQQINILKAIQQDNIVPFINHYETEKLFILVTELQEGGELINGVISKYGNNYSESQARNIVTQLLNAITSLHAKKIIHKSVLVENLLFHDKNSDVIKLTGFTLSHGVGESKGISGGGNPAFQAPELIDQQQYSTPADMWAVGVVAYILLCGYSPFVDSNTIRLYAKIRQATFKFDDKDWSNVSKAGQSFISSLIIGDQNKRLDVNAAPNHEWIKASGGAALPNVVENLKHYYDS